ncbi:MAG: hemerythrin [Desulfobacteraceae bacterium]|nr:MAG: hemerythrin [Desulfobacteraceae bacterium]
MPLIQWNASFNIHIDMIDKQHHLLVKLINELYDALIDGKDREVLGKKIDQLGIYATMHFAREEHYFDILGYPLAEPHKKEHTAFEKQILQFEKDFSSGKKDLTMDIMRFLSTWLVKHIKGSDKKYGPFLRERGVA